MADLQMGQENILNSHFFPYTTRLMINDIQCTISPVHPRIISFLPFWITIAQKTNGRVLQISFGRGNV